MTVVFHPHVYPVAVSFGCIPNVVGEDIILPQTNASHRLHGYGWTITTAVGEDIILPKTNPSAPHGGRIISSPTTKKRPAPSMRLRMNAHNYRRGDHWSSANYHSAPSPRLPRRPLTIRPRRIISHSPLENISHFLDTGKYFTFPKEIFHFTFHRRSQ